MAVALQDFLSALFAACPDEPVVLMAGEAEVEARSAADIDMLVEKAQGEPVYVRPVTGGLVPFFHTVIENVNGPEEWQDLTLEPTAALYRDGLMIAFYALDRAEPASPDTALLFECMGGAEADELPTPDSNGWSLVHLNPEAYQTFATLQASFGAETPLPARSTPRLGKRTPRRRPATMAC
jgi:hypothetical protein